MSLVLTVAGCSGGANEGGAGGAGGQPNAAGHSGMGGVSPGGGSGGTLEGGHGGSMSGGGVGGGGIGGSGPGGGGAAGGVGAMGGAARGGGGRGGTSLAGTGGAAGMGPVGGMGAVGQAGGAAGGRGGGGVGGEAAGMDPHWAQWPMPNGPIDVAAGAPNLESYTDNGDGTITDNITGLMWQKGQSTNPVNLAQATSDCSTLPAGGYSDWRVPTRIELMSLVDVQTSMPAIDTNYFPVTDWLAPTDFWTSSAPAGSSGTAYAVAFNEGGPYYIRTDSSLSVRCVRRPGAIVAAGAVAAPAPPGRYTFPTAGTVYDTKTKLTWQQSLDSPNYDLAGAKVYCAGLGATLGGVGWRLPTLTELQTIVDESRWDPALDPIAFPGPAPNITWASSPVAGDSSSGWIANSQNGNMGFYDVTYHAYARCVR